jgi:nitrogen regulatory protein PII
MMAPKRTSAIAGRKNVMHASEPPTIKRKPVPGTHPAMNLPLSTRVAARLVLSAVAVKEIWTSGEWLGVLETTGLCDSELPTSVVVKLAEHESLMRIREYLTEPKFTDLTVKHIKGDGYLASIHVGTDFYAGVGETAFDALVAVIQRHLETNPHDGKILVTETHEVDDDGTT